MKLTSEGRTNQTPVMVDADFSVQSAILYGLQKPTQDVVQQGTFNCPTGNCSWPSFESLAVCNRCIDLSSSLERTVSNGAQYWSLGKDNNGVAIEVDGGTSFRLPNGLYLDNANKWKYGTSSTGMYSGAVMMATLGTANASETVSAQDLDTLIWSMSMIRAEPDSTNASAAWPDLPLLATECALFYCVNHYETLVSNGTLREVSRQVADSTRDKTSWQPEGANTDILNGSQLTSLAFDKFYSLVPRTDLVLLSPETGSRFNISKAAVDSISDYYQSTFASELHNYSEGIFNGYYMTSGQVQYEPGVMQALFGSKDLNATFTALAVSMSNAIRTGADETFDGVPISVIGSKGDIVTFYRIVWPWISLHCFIVAVGIVFMVLTIWENKRHGWEVPLWRSSGLAIASRGEAVTDVLSGMQTLEDMWKKARISRVTLFDKNDVASSSLEHLDFDPLEESES